MLVISSGDLFWQVEGKRQVVFRLATFFNTYEEAKAALGEIPRNIPAEINWITLTRDEKRGRAVKNPTPKDSNPYIEKYPGLPRPVRKDEPWDIGPTQVWCFYSEDSKLNGF